MLFNKFNIQSLPTILVHLKILNKKQKPDLTCKDRLSLENWTKGRMDVLQTEALSMKDRDEMSADAQKIKEDYYFNVDYLLEDDLPVGTLEETGMDSIMILKASGRIHQGKYGEIHSMLIYRNNKNIKIPIEDSGKNGYGYTWWISEVGRGSGKTNIYRANGWVDR